MSVLCMIVGSKSLCSSEGLRSLGAKTNRERGVRVEFKPKGKRTGDENLLHLLKPSNSFLNLQIEKRNDTPVAREFVDREFLHVQKADELGSRNQSVRRGGYYLESSIQGE